MQPLITPFIQVVQNTAKVFRDSPDVKATPVQNIGSVQVSIFVERKGEKFKRILAERSFDLRTSGLWAQHASTAPLCY